MRVPALLLVLVAIAMLAAGCAGGPSDGDQRLEEACERQIEEIAEEEGGTPTAKSTEERLEETTLVECAGQATKVVAADAEVSGEEGEDSDGGAENAGDEENADGEEAAPADNSTDGDAPTTVELDPEARSLFAETCGSCHTLSDAETSGAVGPLLDETELDSTGVAEVIENGRGAMPAGLLQGADAEAVAEYVAAAAAAE